MDPLILATAASTYAAANLDDLMALTALFALDRAAGGKNTFRIWTGQVIGIGLLTAASVLAAEALDDVPASCIRYLALIPISIGIRAFLQANSLSLDDRPRAEARSTLAVIGITVANGGDNLALYVPLLHGFKDAENALVLGCFAAMTLLWCTIASLIGRTVRSPRLLRSRPRLTSVAYIAIGFAALIRSWLP
jgi:cadmium resistance protein CadD (predicted permease)